MRFYSNGKLLITGEYVILDGAVSLAVPSLLGQSLEIINNESKHIKWFSKNSDGRVWFHCTIRIESLKVETTSSNEISNKLIEIIKVIREVNPTFLSKSGLDITSELTFDKDWGLGSSSTLISNLSQFAEIDPYELNNMANDQSQNELLLKMNTKLNVLMDKEVGLENHVTHLPGPDWFWTT